MAASLTKVAAEEQTRFDAATLPRERKARGHFGTPADIADFMAGMFTRIPSGAVRILDPGAGVGTLSAALCQRILPEDTSRTLYFELWENDRQLEPRLRTTMQTCRKSLRDSGHQMDFAIRTDDFVVENSQPPLFRPEPAELFDLVIMNPPYFKLRKDAEMVRAMEHVVHGQPNIYALFMAVAAELLSDGAELVAITPRSYFNGPYFKRFRKWFFDRMTARRIHLFESRVAAFREDEVLQENVILLAEKKGQPLDVVLTSSQGRTFDQVDRHTLPYRRVIENASGDHLVRVATSELERQIVEVVDSLPYRFRDLPYRISTGPVVTFRATEFLCLDRQKDTAPLLWMHNVRPFITQFRPKGGKPMHIRAIDESKRLLLPARRYVLLKRFTAKEERRRLVAGIVEPKDCYSPLIGLENHLNYVYAAAGELSCDEAFGLASLLNSVLIDRYFRAISGNTQVNAAEIRAMPLPTLEAITKIGGAVARLHEPAPPEVERIVGNELRLSPILIKSLCEAAT